MTNKRQIILPIIHLIKKYILGLLFKGYEMLLSELLELVDKELIVSVPNANCIQFCDPTQPKTTYSVI